MSPEMNPKRGIRAFRGRMRGASPWIPHKAKTELNDTNFLVRIKNFDKEIRVAHKPFWMNDSHLLGKMMEQVIILTSKKRLIFTPS